MCSLARNYDVKFRTLGSRFERAAPEGSVEVTAKQAAAVGNTSSFLSP